MRAPISETSLLQVRGLGLLRRKGGLALELDEVVDVHLLMR